MTTRGGSRSDIIKITAKKIEDGTIMVGKIGDRQVFRGPVDPGPRARDGDFWVKEP